MILDLSPLALAAALQSASVDLAEGATDGEAFRVASTAVDEVAPGLRGSWWKRAARGRAEAFKEAPKAGADVGVLSCPGWCPAGYARYCDGASPDPCVDEECCSGTDACQGFSGCVKRDGSCNGEHACRRARANKIARSCVGEKACFLLGYGGDHHQESEVGTVADSCHSKMACEGLGAYGGTVGDVKRSCLGERACLRLASGWTTGWPAYQYVSPGGSVGGLTASCNEKNACAQMGEVNGSVGGVTRSCNRESACANMGSYSGVVASVKGSCNSLRGCYMLAASSVNKDNQGWDQTPVSSVGPLVRSCNGAGYSCFDLAANGGTVAGIAPYCCNSDTHTPCRGLAAENGATTGHVISKRPAEQVGFFPRDEVGSVEDCFAACAAEDRCEHIQWRNHSKWRPCEMFRGEPTVWCGQKAVCIEMQVSKTKIKVQESAKGQRSTSKKA